MYDYSAPTSLYHHQPPTTTSYIYSRKINVCVGTRQGGLSSPFLFNIFYHDLISILSNCTGGITIHNESYNVFCYSDDLIISSLSIRGLRDMINAAKSYIVEHVLNFNPTKTICKTVGTCNFDNAPKWYLHGSLLHSDNLITSLGTTLTGMSQIISTPEYKLQEELIMVYRVQEYVVMG